MADVLSVIGVGLGAMSLALQITDECIKMYKYFSEASHMPDSYQYLRVRVQIEQQRFLNFAVEAGLLFTDGNVCRALRINQGLLEAILVEIRSLFEDYEKANGKYVDTMPQGAIDWNEQWEPQTKLVERLCVAQRQATGEKLVDDTNERRVNHSVTQKFGAQAKRTSQKLRAVITEPKRLIWINADRESFESLIARLGELNSFLVALLDGTQANRLEQEVTKSYTEILHLRDDIRGLEDLLAALALQKEIPEPHKPTFCHESADLFLEEARSEMRANNLKRDHLHQLTSLKIKVQYAKRDDQDERQHSDEKEPLPDCLDLSSFQFHDRNVVERHSPRRTNATWLGQNVSIEWIDYPSRRLRQRSSESLMERRVGMLTRLLSAEKPIEFRVLPCLGYARLIQPYGEPVFGLVFQKPCTSESNGSASIVTLRQRLETRPKPSLTARIFLAAILAESLEYFHAINWLHKGLRSDNVIFFDTAGLNQPYISGFELSRPDDGLDLTQKPLPDPRADLYRHPNAQSAEAETYVYRKSYDMYSLGIMLLEIAYWKPLEHIMGIENVMTMTPPELSRLKSRLLNSGLQEKGPCEDTTSGMSKYLRKVEEKCGDAYQEIVETCLEAELAERPAYRGESGISINLRLRYMFEDRVTGRLRAMREVVKGSE